MASLAHPLAAGLGGDAAVSRAISDRARLELWGEEILFDTDMQLAPNGDYQLVTGWPALRQAIRIRLITNPGELPWSPTFGVGINSYLGALSTDSAKAELRGRIRDQLLQDPRLDAVSDVGVEEQTVNNVRVLVVSVRVTAAGTSQPLGSFTFGGS